MSKLLDYLNALDTNAVLIQAHKNNPLQAARDFGLSHEEQLAVTGCDKQKVAAFLDIPFKDFDAIDITEGYFRSWEYEKTKAPREVEEIFA
ncbi:hypothetical protein [Undibacterium sp. Tian12W]|uniref:hypothetical protein n=1 Tax=Undibacterium sp. Tian12W TaxID=3413054 RepID=UPI003BF15A96